MPYGRVRRISYRMRTKRAYIEFEQRENISNFAKRNISTQEVQMDDYKNRLREDSIEFALKVSDVCEKIKGCSIYVTQLLRASSSIGANLHEAKYAQSRADFINKLEISLKESSETEYWLELLFRKNKITQNEYKELKNFAGSIRRRLISSITTAKENANK